MQFPACKTLFLQCKTGSQSCMKGSQSCMKGSQSCRKVPDDTRKVPGHVRRVPDRVRYRSGDVNCNSVSVHSILPLRQMQFLFCNLLLQTCKDQLQLYSSNFFSVRGYFFPAASIASVYDETLSVYEKTLYLNCWFLADDNQKLNERMLSIHLKNLFLSFAQYIKFFSDLNKSINSFVNLIS